MVNLNRGSVNITMSSLIKWILVALAVVLIIWGISSGTLNPLIERVGLLMDGVQSYFGGDSSATASGDFCIEGVGCGNLSVSRDSCIAVFSNNSGLGKYYYVWDLNMLTYPVEIFKVELDNDYGTKYWFKYDINALRWFYATEKTGVSGSSGDYCLVTSNSWGNFLLGRDFEEGKRLLLEKGAVVEESYEQPKEFVEDDEKVRLVLQALIEKSKNLKVKYENNYIRDPVYYDVVLGEKGFETKEALDFDGLGEKYFYAFGEDFKEIDGKGTGVCLFKKKGTSKWIPINCFPDGMDTSSSQYDLYIGFRYLSDLEANKIIVDGKTYLLSLVERPVSMSHYNPSGTFLLSIEDSIKGSYYAVDSQGYYNFKSEGDTYWTFVNGCSGSSSSVSGGVQSEGNYYFLLGDSEADNFIDLSKKQALIKKFMERECN